MKRRPRHIQIRRLVIAISFVLLALAVLFARLR
jgi:hypothetical protein